MLPTARPVASGRAQVAVSQSAAAAECARAMAPMPMPMAMECPKSRSGYQCSLPQCEWQWQCWCQCQWCSCNSNSWQLRVLHVCKFTGAVANQIQWQFASADTRPARVCSRTRTRVRTTACGAALSGESAPCFKRGRHCACPIAHAQATGADKATDIGRLLESNNMALRARRAARMNRHEASHTGEVL